MLVILFVFRGQRRGDHREGGPAHNHQKASQAGDGEPPCTVIIISKSEKTNIITARRDHTSDLKTIKRAGSHTG